MQTKLLSISLLFLLVSLSYAGVYETEFDKLDEKWWEVWANKAGGGDESFIKFERSHLIIDVPSGSSWGTTGIVSKTPLLSVPTDPKTKISMSFRVDLDFTKYAWIALVRDKLTNPLLQDHIYLHFGRKGIDMEISLITGQAREREIAGKFSQSNKPNVTLVMDIYRDKITVSDDKGLVLINNVMPRYMEPGIDLYCFLYAESPEQGLPTSFSIDWMKVVTETGESGVKTKGLEGLDPEEAAVIESLRRYFETH